MSQAFMKEGDAQWLHDIPPTLHALQAFLSAENNGIRVYERRNYFNDKTNEEIWEMSNGGTYKKNEQGKWTEIVEL